MALSQVQVNALFEALHAEVGYSLTVDLETCTVALPNGETWAFEVDAFRRDCLLKGLDDIGITLERAEAIKTFERQHRDRFPWVFEDIAL